MSKLKICGIRSMDEILELADLNIDYFGCIFAKSPRQVTVELAKNITETAHKYNKKTVGVFVNSSLEDIKKIRDIVKFDAVQLHGDESPEFCRKLGGTIWKVFRVFDEIPDIDPYKEYIEYPLFDTKGKDYGGNGIIFNWDILKDITYPYILAGGLSDENIKSALKYSPAVLDVNSKVEKDNRKNKDLISNIINVIK
jgi:phosphoribosylanthranilate isomerase